MEKYEQISVIGEGSYGVVLKCKHRGTDQTVAVKKFLETEEDATIRRMALREIRMLKKLKHENLVTMIEVFRHKKRFYLVFEYLDGTILDELDKMPAGLGEERCRERIFQVVRAIRFCHSNNIIHRDIKPENVLVSSLGVVKLCDFGFARLISCTGGEACTEYVATRWYRAPELLVAEPNYGPGIDVWAVGCLFAEMMTGDPLFPGESDIDQFFLIVKMLGKPCLRHQQLVAKNTELHSVINIRTEDAIGLHNFFSSWSSEAIDFLNCCIKMDPQHRLSADQLLIHPYFTNDRFSLKFSQALREKVIIEFNKPLLRKLKIKSTIPTNKKDNVKRRQTSENYRWTFTLTEGSIKQTFKSDTLYSHTIKNIVRSAQGLNIMHENALNSMKHTLLQPSDIKYAPNIPKLLRPTSNIVEIQTSKNSFKNLLEVYNNTNMGTSVPAVAQRKENRCSPVLLKISPSFQSLQFGCGDTNKHHSKISSHFRHNLNYNFTINQAPQLSNPSEMKCSNRILFENIFANGDRGAKTWNNPSICTKNIFKKNCLKSKTEELYLPVLPGATNTSENRNTLLKMELLKGKKKGADYRYQRSKRKRITLDIGLPFVDNGKD